MAPDTTSNEKSPPELDGDDPDSKESNHPDVEELLTPKDRSLAYQVVLYALMLGILLIVLFAIGIPALGQLFMEL